MTVRRTRQRRWFWLVAAVLLLLPPAFAIVAGPLRKIITGDVTPLNRSYQLVKHVVDSDTLVLLFGERVRLIGVAKPESVRMSKPVEHFAEEAAAVTRRMVEGKRVRLEFDDANTTVGHKDKDGYTLAYVFLGDGTLVNAEIIKQGYAFALTRYPFKYVEEFRQLEREAREEGRGLWKIP